MAGTFSFVPSLPEELPPTDAGDLECEWASGRWKIGALRTAPLDGFVPPAHLTIDFLRKTMNLTDDDGSTLVAVGNDAFVTPADAPPRGEGDRSGVLDLTLLQVNLDSTPEDPVEVHARFTLGLPGGPAGLRRSATPRAGAQAAPGPLLRVRGVARGGRLGRGG